jgi:hypothetical protein
VFLAGLPLPAASAAEFGIVPGSFAVRMFDAEGEPENRAGSHPDRLQIAFALETEGTGTSVKDLVIDMPPGFGGDPNAVPACPRQAHEEGEECLPESQVGVLSFGVSGEPQPLYVLEPEPGQIAAFTSKSGLAIPFELELRPDDFGVTFIAKDLAEGAPNSAQIELWGIPAEHQVGSSAPPTPFLTTPSNCGPLEFTLRARSREAGAEWLSESTEAGPLVGCEALRFSPELGMRLSNPVADSPSGLRTTLSLSQGEGAELADAQLRDVTIAMPPGLTVSPAGATGLALCTDAQLGLGNGAPANCPAASRVGNAEFTAAVLPEPVVGAIYLGEQKGDERFRLFVVAPGPGAVLKFVSALQPDPVTGLLTTTLHDLPPLAISKISLSFNGGPTALLATPLACGTATGSAHFVPYGGGPAVDAGAALAIASVLPGLACPGPLPFTPQLLVSASSHQAGHVTSFSTVMRRRSGEALPARFSFTLPAGLSTALGTVEECPEALVASGNCPAASRVGSVQAEAGSGPAAAALAGGAYLAGPYHRAPFSLVLAFQAALGPFDLGTVAVQAAAQFDRRSGRLAVVTDPLPSVVGGAQIRFRGMAISLDRSGLVRNPTSCGPHSVDAALESQEGTSATFSLPYPVKGCGRLGFAPRWRARLLKRGPLRRHDPVGVQISGRFRQADTSLRSLALSLPPALKLGVGGLAEICSRVDAQHSHCPPGSRVGTARARTPLLGELLRGNLYVVQPRDDGEPDIWVGLSGRGISFPPLRGTSSNDHGRSLTRLSGLPDLPLSSFSLRLGGPATGLLSFEATPCRRGKPRRLGTEIRLRGQNGARHASELLIPTGARCGSAAGR